MGAAVEAAAVAAVGMLLRQPALALPQVGDLSLKRTESQRWGEGVSGAVWPPPPLPTQAHAHWAHVCPLAST